MRLLAFSDWRAQPLAMIEEIVRKHSPDAILYAGDDLDRLLPVGTPLLVQTPSHRVTMTYPGLSFVRPDDKHLVTTRFLRTFQEISLPTNNFLERIGVPFYYVAGNDDNFFYNGGHWYRRLEDKTFTWRGHEGFPLQETPNGRIGVRTVGHSSNPSGIEHSGGLPTGIYARVSPHFGTFALKKGPDTVRVFGARCSMGVPSRVLSIPRSRVDILLSHIPSYGTVDLSKRFDVGHIGSRRLLKAVKRLKPRLVICGHSHMWRGMTATVGKSLVINVSSHDGNRSEGNYAIVDTDTWSVAMQKAEWPWLRKLRGTRSLYRRIEHKAKEADEWSVCRELRHAAIGFTKPRVQSDRMRSLKRLTALGVDTSALQKRVKSLGWKKPKIVKQFDLDPDEHVFVDVETGLAEGHVPGRTWLVGIWYEGHVFQFRLPGGMGHLSSFLHKNNVRCLVSWTAYDHKAMRDVLAKSDVPMQYMDACQRVANCVVWHNYGLHELYSVLCPDVSEPPIEIEGHIAGIYADHLIFPSRTCRWCPSKKKVMRQIERRNRQDLLHMVRLCRVLFRASRGASR